MLSPVTRGQKSLIRTAECLEFFKHPFEMRDDAKRRRFYVNPGQDTATGVLLPGMERGRAGSPGPPQPAGHRQPRAARGEREEEGWACPEDGGVGDTARRGKQNK